jgi:uncharacterized protein YcgI (DUF1989 family)
MSPMSPMRPTRSAAHAATVTLALTDTQRSVLARLRTLVGAPDLDALAAAAIEHDRRRPPDPRWRQARPSDPGAYDPPDAGDLEPPGRLRLTLPPASGGAVTLSAGDELTLEQLDDGQGVDVRAFAADGISFSAAQTRWMHGINPTVGASLWRAQPQRPLLTIVRDTAPGHDLTFPPCSGPEYERYTGIAGHRGCAEMHAAALAAAGYAPWPGEDVLNLWLPSAVDPDGMLRSWPAWCRAGDRVVLRADDDVLVTLTTCADDLYGTSQYEPKPVAVIVDPADPARPPRVHGWSTAPPPAALARHRLSVSLSADDAEHVDGWARRGWLGDDRPSVTRALLLRLYESSGARPGGPERATAPSGARPGGPERAKAPSGARPGGA